MNRCGFGVRKNETAKWVGLAVVAALLAGCSGAESQTGDDEGRDPGREGEALSTVTLPTGTHLWVVLDQELSTENSRTGDRFTATVEPAVRRAEEVVIPSGSRLHGRVTAVQEAGEGSDAAVLKIDYTTIEVRGRSYPLQTSVVEANPETKSSTSTGEAVAKVGGGAAAGAILGRIIGGDEKGALVGAAVGAAAGTAIVLGTRDVEAVLAAGSAMRLRLDEALQVRLGK